MKKKFKIMYSKDYHDVAKRGKPYLPQANCFVVMNGSGVFFLMDTSPYYPSIRKLSDVLGKFDVVWRDDYARIQMF